MIRRTCGVLAASLLALVLVGAGASAASSQSTITVTMSTEAWYQEPPPCVSLIDCSAAPAATPYPQNTVHVSATGGQETARTYLAFGFQVPFGASLVGGTLSLPVDQDPGAGTLQPDQADMQACLVTESFTAVRGSLATPPKADCNVSWGAAYDEKTKTFTVDLAQFLPKWQSGEAALALLPTKQALQGGETWHVAFFATTKPSKSSPPITATLSYTAPTYQASSSTSYPLTGGTSAGTSGPSTSSPSGGSFPTFTGGGFGSKPTRTTTTTTTTTFGQGSAAPATASLPSVAGFAGPGFAYRIVWALPLLLLALFGAIGRALTKELYRREA